MVAQAALVATGGDGFALLSHKAGYNLARNLRGAALWNTTMPCVTCTVW